MVLLVLSAHEERAEAEKAKTFGLAVFGGQKLSGLKMPVFTG